MISDGIPKFEHRRLGDPTACQGKSETNSKLECSKFGIIPSEVEKSRCASLEAIPRGLLTSLRMTAGDSQSSLITEAQRARGPTPAFCNADSIVVGFLHKRMASAFFYASE
jgi:hypothetical protein